MTPTPEAARCCRTCDRSIATREQHAEAKVRWLNRDFEHDPEGVCFANDGTDCRRHAVDWRAKYLALTAEQSPALPADVAALLAEWKRLAKGASKGEWQEGTAGGANVVRFDGDDITGIARVDNPANRAFVIAAHAIVPQAVEIIEALLKGASR